MDMKVFLIMAMCIGISLQLEIESTNEIIAALQLRVNQQQEIIAEQQESLAEQQELTGQLQWQLTAANATITMLQKKCEEGDNPLSESDAVAELRSHMAILRQVVLNQVEKSQEQERSIAEQRTSIRELKQYVEQLGGPIDDVQSLQTPIGFTARLAGDYYRPQSIEPLPFTDVLVNHGGYYDAESRRFNCPLYGMYYFTFSIYSGNIQTTSNYFRSTARLVHRVGREGFPQDIVGANSGTGTETNMYIQSSTSAVLTCSPGDAVWVRPDHTIGNQMYGNHAFPRTVFTGFLIGAL